MQIRQFGSQTDWFAIASITEEEGHSSTPASAATGNSGAPGAVGGASLAAGAQCTVLAGSSPASVCARLAAGKRDKINIEIPAGQTAAAVRTLDHEMILFTLF